MDLGVLSTFLPLNYVTQVKDAEKSIQKIINTILYHKKLLDYPLSDHTIRHILNLFSMMDSNNFINTCGVGEREGRILSHGIGRSGQLTELQPKALGSSCVYQLTNLLVKDAFVVAGLTNVNSCLIVPLATGMALTMCFLTLKKSRPKAKYIIFSRIDQKSCFKSILTAGFIPIIIEGQLTHDGTDDEMRIKLDDNIKNFTDFITKFINVNAQTLSLPIESEDDILCFLSTTSCFAPRGSDNISNIGMFCAHANIVHIVNNAYGMNSLTLIRQINKAVLKGARIDAMVQSCDKNFMVPVGGAIINDFKPLKKANKGNMDNKGGNNSKTCTTNQNQRNFIEEVANIYPGRASITPSLDIFITLLSMGAQRYKQLLISQLENFAYFKSELEKVAQIYNERILNTPNNPISIAMSLDNIMGQNNISQRNAASNTKPKKSVTEIGAMLYTRRVTGARVVYPTSKSTIIDGYNFVNWGSHHSKYPYAYLTVACTLGLERHTIDKFCAKLRNVLKDFTSTN